MDCDRCKKIIEAGEESKLHGQTLCEDCYIETLSPAKACDPWAVYSAKSFMKEEGFNVKMTEVQLRILQILKETGGAEPQIISERLQIEPAALEREIATLRHMEKLRAELRAGKKIICIW